MTSPSALDIPSLLDKTIQRLRLDLSGLTVFTEAASGPYMYTPILAARAGAAGVFAVTRDSRYGAKEEIRDRTLEAARSLGVAASIQVLFEKTSDSIGAADIITNSGFVRPIDAALVQWMKPTAVVPLMWETWELRPGEVDLAACRKRGILVLGTNEHHPILRLNRVLGFSVAKLLLERGYSLYSDKILLIGSEEIADSLGDFFLRIGVSFDRVVLKGRVPANQKSHLTTIAKASRFLSEYQIVIVAEHVVDRCIIGKRGLIDPKNLRQEILHVCGRIEESDVREAGVAVFPENPAPFGYMTVSAATVGPLPVIEMNTAGLRVGECMARARLKGLSLAEAKRFTMRHAPAMDF